jgi:hypothetical protein
MTCSPQKPTTDLDITASQRVGAKAGFDSDFCSSQQATLLLVTAFEVG